ncbi:MAG: T9SS type A sorting domain-containing protein [Candidatus Latescibacteria bacterium]|nr:T9SS type A sorting domain-containing protein [Candidatus Latescibacterota bacterium]
MRSALNHRLPLHLRTSLPLLVLLLVLAQALPALATELQLTWRADASLRALSSAEDLTALLAATPGHTEVAQQPSLPLLPLRLAIPSGERVTAVRLEDVLADRVPLAQALADFEGVVDENGNRLSVAPVGQDAGESFPADYLYAQTTGSFRGFASAELLLAPLRYRMENGAPLLERLLSARVVVETAPDPGARVPLRQRAEDLALGERLLVASSANPEAVRGFAPPSAVRQDDGPFDPRSVPSIEGSGVDMVIVCAPEYAATFQTLADFKLTMGIPTVVRDTDWIRANYPQGADLQETLRFFLQDALEKWGVRWVMLAGDTDTLPARYVHSYFKDPPEDIPAELYYADLDGDWNGDNDQYFGESNYGGTQGDAVDMIADVNLGRLPVRNAADAQLMVDKIIAYSSQPDPTYTANVGFYAEVLFPADWQIGDPVELITRNGADYAEDVYDNLLPPQMQALRFYETDWLYPGTLPESPAAVLDDMANRAHIVHHVGHGFRYTMSMGTGSIVADNMYALTNGLDHLLVIYALNCTSCAIDYNCLGEAVLRAPAGGGVVIVGSMREAFPNTSIYYQDSFFESLFADSMSVGECFSYSHNTWSTLGIVEGSHRWTQMSYVLIGDPSLDIWLDTPEALSAALVTPYTLDSTTLELQVSRLGSPLEGARVIASKAGEDRAEGVTDALGMVSIPFRAESLGDIDLSLLHRQDLPTFLAQSVAAGTGPRLSAELLAVEDDPIADPTVNGNADGRLDAGETVRLALRITNAGSAAANALTLDLTLPGGEAAVTESHVATGQTVAAGGQLDLTGLFLVDAPLTLADRRYAALELALSYTGGGDVDQLDVETHAPLPRLFAFDIDDSAGNGDGNPDAGEVYVFQPEWKNYGSTPVDGWQASLTPIDPAGQVLSGAVTLPLLDLLERGASAGINLRENSVSSPNRFALTLTGPLGGTRVDTVQVRRPEAPGMLYLDSSLASDVIDVAWDIPAALPASYLVYRSQSQGGPYSLVSSEPTQHAYFRNDHLEQSTTYYFVVESVDSAGFRSLPSVEFSTSTNPSMLAGWPLQTNFGTASSVVIGDIDGDGDKELAAGAELLYAWHADGVEIQDGDSNSATYGVLSPSGGEFTAALAMADVDPAFPGLEIIGATRNPFGIYVYHGDGTLVSGWPKTLPNWCWGTPAVADVDGDGQVEIFAICLDGNLYAWNANGTPQIGTTGIFASGFGAWSRSSPTLCNLDADPDLEIVLGSYGSKKLYAFNPNGSTVSGFPVTFSDAIHSSPSVGDLDGDYDLEIVFLCENDSLYVINNNGTRRPGFPVYLQSNAAGLAPSPALVDFEDDGQMEIVAGGVVAYTSMNLTVLDNNGVTRPGWPLHFEESSEASPVVVDLDGDGELEIMLGMETGYLYAFEADATDMPGFPILTEAELRSCPTVDDLDGDFSVDVALYGWDAYVYVWNMPAFYRNGLAQWKMFRANPGRTGVFTREEQNTGGDDLPVSAPDGLLFANYPNPFNPSTTIRFVTPAGEGLLPVTLSIHDIQGRRIATLQDGPLSRGVQQSVVWDGKSDTGAPVASGIYFARVEMGDVVHSQKMVLLK